MTLYRAQAIFPMWTFLPRDVITNQFHFWDTEDDDPVVVANEISFKLSTFYSGVFADSGMAASWIHWNEATVRCYRLSDPIPRPVYEDDLTITTGTISAGTVPTEVACVLSWHAATVAGVRRQSLQNRIFLGGLGSSAMSAGSSSSFPTIAPAFVADVAAAAAALLAANGDREWVQVAAGNVVRQITGGWVDNGPDTQRRRSVDAASRTTWA